MSGLITGSGRDGEGGLNAGLEVVEIVGGGAGDAVGDFDGETVALIDGFNTKC